MISIETFGLRSRIISNTFPGKILDGLTSNSLLLYSQVDGMALVVFGYSNEDSLVSSTTSLSIFEFCTKIGIIKLYDATQEVMLIPHFRGTADPAKIIPCSFIKDLNLSGQSGDTAFVTDYQTERSESFGQRKMAAMYDGIDCRENLEMIIGALILSA